MHTAAQVHFHTRLVAIPTGVMIEQIEIKIGIQFPIDAAQYVFY
jgi:predicted subunit of tRNA(5-methylaminomethyl-2-thiouridylate) methyltransferase